MRYNVIIIMVVLFLFPCRSMAQGAEKGKKKVRKKAPVAKMDEVVVTATKTKRRRENITKSLTIIGSEEIESRKAETVSDFLRDVPGLHVRQNGPTGSKTDIDVGILGLKVTQQSRQHIFGDGCAGTNHQYTAHLI